VSGITVDPSGLSANAQFYGSHAAAVESIHLTLARNLDKEGEPWGNDEAGSAFAGHYVGPALAALRMMITTQRGLESMVSGVYQWAQSYVDSDESLRQDLLKSFGSE
jgi:hypothetical protein